MKIEVAFAPFLDGIMFDVIEFEPYTGRKGIIEWAAFSENSAPNDNNIRWSKPYEDEEIDEKTKKELLYFVALEIRKLGYTCYRDEYIGDETKAEIDRIIGTESTSKHTEDNQNVEKKESKDNPALYGMCFGVCFGAVMGLIFGNITIGMCIGIPIGLAAGLIWQKKK
jgi:hypothetical protein